MGRIIFEKVIVHSLDNKTNNKKLSDFELEDYSRIEPQLARHIQRSEKHDNRKIAFFTGKTNIVKDACEKIFKNDDAFVNESQTIAEHLFRCMTGNASPANLILCKYSEEGIKKIALLKMDFNEIFTPIEKVVDGKLKIELEAIDKSLPSKNEKLQKCVFISENIFLKDIEEEHILLLDKQRGKEVSEFFSKAFLSCELKNTNNQNFGVFIHEFTSYINDEYKDNPQVKSQLFKKFKEVLINCKGQDINVPDFLGEIFTDEGIKDKALEKIGEKENFDFEFNVDPEYLNGRFQKVRYVTNSGITIVGEGDVFESDNFEIIDKNEDGNVDIIIRNVKYDVLDN
ncbi:nucleoid-associated protein [Clostridium sp. NSJ-6]|uniref:Nucleoid-associated protein n=1 Tax=Clostridium hominis TaxID=2763036 RepID=A0ABR7D973_9CLOT|nr:nucleoid-associated protein [Clostridium hominis]MBC5627877.1 nucleoid-associated protein [Clostridium hominis]